MTLLERWWQDPVASATIFISIVAGIFAVYQLRALPAERRRRMLDTMVSQYDSTRDARTDVLEQFPPLFLLARAAVSEAVESHISEQEALATTQNAEDAAITRSRLSIAYRLRDEIPTHWPAHEGISRTSASEILSSEFKIRCLLWCVEVLRDETARQELGITDTLFETAVRAVNEVNQFALEYENGAYPPRTVFGQLHRSLLSTSKALEPVVWARSLNGRWGRRILRLSIGAQHFNDVTKIHRSDTQVWSQERDGAEAVIVLEPALTENIFGVEMLRHRASLRWPRMSLFRLKLRGAYWTVVGKVSLAPRLPFTTFGGYRLWKHRRAEGQLSALIRYILGPGRGEPQAQRLSLSFSWDAASKRDKMISLSKEALTNRNLQVINQ